MRQERPGIFWKALRAYKRLLSTGFVFSGDDIFDIARAQQTGEQTTDMEEAAAYSGIGTGKLREITNEEGCNFVLWVGTKRLIKKRLFDQFIERSYSISYISSVAKTASV